MESDSECAVPSAKRMKLAGEPVEVAPEEATPRYIILPMSIATE